MPSHCPSYENTDFFCRTGYILESAAVVVLLSSTTALSEADKNMTICVKYKQVTGNSLHDLSETEVIPIPVRTCTSSQIMQLHTFCGESFSCWLHELQTAVQLSVIAVLG